MLLRVEYGLHTRTITEVTTDIILCAIGLRACYSTLEIDVIFIWPPCVADADIIFLPCGFFLLFIFFFIPRLISAVADWMSTILPHMMWP